MTARDALLGALLTRRLAILGHEMTLPDIIGTPVGLTFYVGIVAGVGGTKSSATGVARRVMPNSNSRILEGVPLGSGQGLVEIVFETSRTNGKTTKTKIADGAIVVVDEGQVADLLGGQAGSVLLPTLRSAWIHAPIGQANATIEARRMLQGWEFVYGAMFCFVPETAAPIVNDRAGLCERFLWLAGVDPGLPDTDVPDPGPIAWKTPTAALVEAHRRPDNIGPLQTINRVMIGVADEIAIEIREARRPVIRTGEGAGHDLLKREKVAFGLASFEGRLDIDGHDWELAKMVTDTSDRVLAAVRKAIAGEARRIEAATIEKRVRSDLASDEGHERRALRSGATAVAKAVRKHADEKTHAAQGGGCTRNCLTTAPASKYRLAVGIDAIIEEAKTFEWIALGEDGRWRPGRRKP
jgi:hypothetical protein